ncbi:MAG: signal recognition particle protein [Actinobacteria bacterium]|nr:signal recognition particle protein [Actinomycetota bacterium]
MFEALSDRLDGIFSKLRGKGVLSEDDVEEILREIRLALLEADVNFKVVKNFLGRVKDDLVGAEASKALNPQQQVVTTVHNELVNTLGGETISLKFAPKPPTVILMAGLQGSGKTTSSAKLARWFKQRHGRNPLLVGCDLQRPAAVEQLKTLGSQIDVPVFSTPIDPVTCAAAGLAEARRMGRDVVIFDTAGRLAIDEELMQQVRDISENVRPDYTFLVIDAMTGQDAVQTAEAFHDTLALDGVILTKLDGDARGGAALSVKEVVGKPIAFASTGEKLKDFDLFHPDRLAGRILGMGDILTLAEQAEEAFEQGEAEEAAGKLFGGQFTLDDFLDQMQKVKKMGSIGNLMKLMPGIPKELKNQEIDDRELSRVEGIIHSMTRHERAKPEIIDASRRARIAKGSGHEPNEVDQLVKQFQGMQTLIKQQFGRGTKKQKKNARKARRAPALSLPAPATGGNGGPSTKKLPPKAKKKGGGRVTPKGGNRPVPSFKDAEMPSMDEIEAMAESGELDGLMGGPDLPNLPKRR